MYYASCRRCCRCAPSQLALLFLLTSTNTIAATWTVTPAIFVSKDYTDNVALSGPASKESKGISILRPSIRINGVGRNLKLGLDYYIQANDFVEKSSSQSTRQAYTLSADSQLVKDELYLKATVRRYPLNTGVGFLEQQRDELLNNVNDVKTYLIEPKFKSVINGNTELQIYSSIEQVDYQQENNNIERPISDFSRFTAGLNARSVDQNSRLKWRAYYYSIIERRSNEESRTRKSGTFDTRYGINNEFVFLAKIGFDANQLNVNQNGSYLSAGFGWHPSPRFRIDVFAGKKYSEIGVKITPSKRATLSIKWRDTVVGLNPGQRWTGLLMWRTKNFVVSGTRLEEVVNYQSLLVSDQQNVATRANLSPTDITFIRKRTSLSITTTRRKLNFKFRAYKESRKDIAGNLNPGDSISADGLPDSIMGALARLFWNNSRRVTSSLIYGVEKIKNESNNEDDILTINAVLVTYRSKDKLFISVKAQHSERVLAEGATETDRNNFVENLLGIKVTFKF